MDDLLTPSFEAARGELLGYLSRLVLRPPVAEELLQTTYLRCLEAGARLPESPEGRRAWLFRVATNLAFDELRRHSTWRETALQDMRALAQVSDAFVERSRAMAGTPETKAIAREHLVACLACTLRNLPERKAAAVLLKEVHGFAIDEIAGLLEATPGQAKNWLQEGRAYLNERYGATCALITKQGVCHQCAELDVFLAEGDADPLPGARNLEARFAIAAADRARPWGAWHRIMFRLLDDLR